jgi:membrane-bound metal-dependent hydrolase YbcI (DUF457 family)
MFIGHDACALAAKPATPRVSLGVLIAAPNLLDLLWPIFLLLGIEHVAIRPGITKMTPLDFYDYPWSHSLAMSIVWASLFALGYWLFTRHAAGAVMCGALVVSHWVLDFITHRPDLPLWPGGPKAGLGLWNHVAATVIIESLMFVIGFAMYLRSTRARDRVGSIALWAFAIFLAVTYIANLLGPPPPGERMIAWSALLLWLMPLWGAWIDRHREARV